MLRHCAMTECVYVFQHVACEDLGMFAEVLSGRGFRAEYIRLFAGDQIPADTAAAQALIFLGGPMSVNDEAGYPYLAEEKAIIRAALQLHKPILGVCLGAQLLAAAAGARVYRGTCSEIGWGPVSLSPEGRRDPVLSGVAHLGAVFHWHAETFDLPAGATRLASSAATVNQAFRIDPCAYGLQFHLEVELQMIDAWMREYPQDLGPDPTAAAQRIRADTSLYARPLRHAALEAMSRFLAVVSRAGAAGL